MAPPGALLYSLVARGPVVLAEHSDVTGNAPMVALSILERLPGLDQKTSYVSDRHVFHILAAEGLVFLVMADESAGKRIPFAFLQEVRQRFLSLYSAVARQAVAYEMNTEFSRVLAERMEFYNTHPEADIINRVTAEVGQLKNIMVENIEKILDRGERLELLVQKTDHLSSDAFAFKRQARTLRNTLWWRHARMAGGIGAGVALLAYLLVAIICSPTFHC